MFLLLSDPLTLSLCFQQLALFFAHARHSAHARRWVNVHTGGRKGGREEKGGNKWKDRHEADRHLAALLLASLPAGNVLLYDGGRH